MAREAGKCFAKKVGWVLLSPDSRKAVGPFANTEDLWKFASRLPDVFGEGSRAVVLEEPWEEEATCVSDGGDLG